MRRVYVVVEGPTERAVVSGLLYPALLPLGVALIPRVVTTKIEPSGRKHTGGGKQWSKWHRDIKAIAGDQGSDARITTMFDLYGLSDVKGFPGIETHGDVRDTSERCDLLEAALAEAVDDPRFLPYIQRHEVEALVLAVPDELASVLPDDQSRAGLRQLRQQLGKLKPEDVNDGRETAPSKRLAKAIPHYSKALHGPAALERAGLSNVRKACPRFNAWVSRLEALGTAPTGTVG